MVGLIERGTDEVVHAGVGDNEGLGAVFLDEEDTGKECSGLGDDETTGFEQEMGVWGETGAGERGGERCGVVLNLLSRVEDGV